MKKNIDLHPQGDEVVNNNVKNVDPNPQTIIGVNRNFMSGIPYIVTSGRDHPVSATEGIWTVSGKVDWEADIPVDSHIPEFQSVTFKNMTLGLSSAASGEFTPIPLGNIVYAMSVGSVAYYTFSNVNVTVRHFTGRYDNDNNPIYTSESYRGSIDLELMCHMGTLVSQVALDFFAHVNLSPYST